MVATSAARESLPFADRGGSTKDGRIPGITRVGMGICKYIVDLYAIACRLYYTCNNVIHRLSLVSALYIMYMHQCWLH